MNKKRLTKKGKRKRLMGHAPGSVCTRICIFGSVCVYIHILFSKFSFLSIIFIRQTNLYIFLKKEFWLALWFWQMEQTRSLRRLGSKRGWGSGDRWQWELAVLVEEEVAERCKTTRLILPGIKLPNSAGWVEASLEEQGGLAEGIQGH